MICAYCNKPITDIRYKTLRKKSYHNECYQLQLGLIEAENRKKAINFTKLKNSNNNQDEEQINQLKEYICDLFQIDKVPFLIEKQIVEYTTVFIKPLFIFMTLVTILFHLKYLLVSFHMCTKKLKIFITTPTK